MNTFKAIRAMDHLQDASDELIGERKPPESILRLIVEIKDAGENLLQHRPPGELPFRQAAKPGGEQGAFGGRQAQQRSARFWNSQIQPVEHPTVLRMPGRIVRLIWRGDKYVTAHQMVFPSSGAVGLVSPLEIADFHGLRVRVRRQSRACRTVLVVSEHGHFRKSNDGKIKHPAFLLDLFHVVRLVLYRIKLYLDGTTEQT